ncbi:hypothetical protein RvY_15832 [Ramazzottius varieornatus]|uniref:C2H2-type domain-containing protein n=1 Tax=Ramazzottius varieornatus TaxID=947166 RepID=A0A1D1VWB4_RAMVA|nr:hypothetical protein RvY_15832 [Ramazzottius varieornatus]
MASQSKGYAKTSVTINASNRLLQNYPTEPIGSRPSYVGELVSLLRDGTQEIQSMLETECDLRFNCKVCGSILPSTRAFVIHKRQFCVTKFSEYTRRNVAMMERISNVVSFETRGLQTDDDIMDIVNPCNARLLIPLPDAQNGVSLAHPPAGMACEDALEDGQNDLMNGDAFLQDVPTGVEVIEPSRPPADGLYKFGQGGMNLLVQKRKKHRMNSSSVVRKKKKKDISPKKVPHGTVEVTTISRPPRSKSQQMLDAVNTPTDSSAHPAYKMRKQSGHSPSPYARRYGETSTRSKRLFTNGFSVESSKASSPAIPLPNGESATSSITDKTSPKTFPELTSRDVKDPAYVKKLFAQLDEVADYVNKSCRECNRQVVSIYNLDRHVATQHLGLRESEYSLISRELRKLRSDTFPSTKNDQSDSLNSSSDRLDEDKSLDEYVIAQHPPTPVTEARIDLNMEVVSQNMILLNQPYTNGHSTQERVTEGETPRDIPVIQKNGMEKFPAALEKLQEVRNSETPVPSLPVVNYVPTTSRSSEMADSITERLSAIIRNPNALKEILTTKDKEPPLLDYKLEDLVDIQKQIYEAADPYLQCCRLCNKQYFDVYVLNRHVMTVHLRLQERACGAINKMIKDHMKKYPQAFEEQGIPVSTLLAPTYVGPHPVRADQTSLPLRSEGIAADSE